MLVTEPDVEPLATDLPLELVRRALGDHEPLVDDGDAIAQAIGLVQVLGREENRRPLGHEALDELPEAESAPGIEAGRRLVEKEHGRPRNKRAGEVEPSAHAAGIRLHDAVAGLRQVELLEQLVRAFAGGSPAHVVEPPDHLEVLEAGHVLVDRGVLARNADLPSQQRGIREDVDAVHPCVPLSGLRRVVRIRSAVVLPAPFGPSRPNTVPVSTVRSTPRRASTVP